MQCSLYVHIPFCSVKCDYCGFYSAPVDSEYSRFGEYIAALLRNAERFFREFGVDRVPTVYIGGGTPSLLGASWMKRLLSGLTEVIPGTPFEFTVEANPESTDEAFLQTCLDWGVTRISLGVQSFYAPSREVVHRKVSNSVLKKGLALIQEAFGNRFSADLIAGLPLQNESILLNDIEQLLSYSPEHISLYALTVDPGTPLETYTKQHKTFLPESEEADALWIAGRDALEKAGYAQYEVSNFVPKHGKPSFHNIRYWRMENWLGLGSAASSTIIDDATGTGRRLTFPPDVTAYINGVQPALEALDKITLMKETVLMGFRYIHGPDEILFNKRFGRGIGSYIPDTLAGWREKGLAEEKPALTKTGLLLLNSFLAEAFAELEATYGNAVYTSHSPAR
ncbi:MAG: radical SAM family heme chaperone HemW [Spirochaetaceae bacterium]|jgi:oxygen-independent coproporphyrinogen-3 oxidase|nr:radical SAM family heme chaperone HemW [Spirochaetaceae bacterium]